MKVDTTPQKDVPLGGGVVTGVSFPELSGVQPLESDWTTQKELVDRLNLLLSAMSGRAEGGAE